MKSLYHKGQVSVSKDFTAPTSSFKKHVILAFIGLFIFIATFIGLMIWFGYLSYNLFQIAGGSDEAIFKYLMAFGLGFLSIFMFKSLFIFKSGTTDIGKKLEQSEEPVLFDYIHQLAEEIGAPKPNKIYLSNNVNASVFYDISIKNLFFPSKKNLLIGLGLVNVLNLGEFKAVLAHEFGHFAQRSMLLGRYVYTAQQIAIMVVNKRDALDKILAGISSLDLRIAWIGWILSILVWAIRSLIQSLFYIVSIAEKALSREMEFQADIVAVSITGSDALINGLSKLKVADQAYQSVVTHINRELQDKKAVFDMFSLQTFYIEKMRWILDNPQFGKSPQIKNGNQRIFNNDIINPPQMWSTHPSDKDREENAKKNYIFSEIDDTEVWELFQNPKNLRSTITAEFIATASVETDLLNNDDSINRYNDEEFNKKYLNPKYHGVYFDRFPFINFKSISEIYDHTINLDDQEKSIKKLYDKNFGNQVTHLNELREEIQMLESVKNEAFTFEKRNIVHRGKRIKRSDIQQIIKSLKIEESIIKNLIKSKDQNCRKTSWAIAKRESPELATYLKSISQLVHYSEHTITNLKDAFGKYNNVLILAMADGKVSSTELIDILSTSHEVHNILRMIYKNEISLDGNIIKKIKKNNYRDLFKEFNLPIPTKNNITSWTQAIEDWVNHYTDALYKLRNGSLEFLLELEEKINSDFENKIPLKFNYQSFHMINEYDTILPGEERPLQLKLGFWDRFYLGDGFIPTASKFTVSAIIIFGAIFLGNQAQKSNLYIYNGLGTEVEVTFSNGNSYKLDRYSKKVIDFTYKNDFKILSSNTKGDTIEYFEPNMSERSSKYLYNIANSGLIIKETISYGYDANIPDEIMGFQRWLIPNADFVMEDPPKTISTSKRSKSDTRTVIYTYGNTNPISLFNAVDEDSGIEKAINSHCIWDLEDDPNIFYWIQLSTLINKNLNSIEYRLRRNPTEVISLRAMMDFSDSTKSVACSKILTMSESNPNNPDLFYLKTRCMDDNEDRNSLFIKGYNKWENNSWLAMASAYQFAYKNDWLKSYYAFGKAISNNKVFQNTYIHDFERINRYVKKAFQKNDFNEISEKNKIINYYTDLENKPARLQETDLDKAYSYINKGLLAKAASIADKNDEIKPLITRIIAASFNAPKESIEESFSYKIDEGINDNTIWMALATAVKHRKKYNLYIEKFEEFENDHNNYRVETTEKFIEMVEDNKIAEAEKLILNIDDFRIQAKHYLLGCIILEEKTPKEWKIKTKTLLFATERPFIKL